jgi:RNA-binding protein YhbY
MFRQSEIQIGKNGITDNFIESLKINFKTHVQVRISVLKSADRDKEKVREMSERILNDLGRNYTSKIIGFTIIVKKWRKPVR